MVLKLYGSPDTTGTLPVAVVLLEKKAEWEFVPIDIVDLIQSKANGTLAQDFLEKQPFGQVPYLVRETHMETVYGDSMSLVLMKLSGRRWLYPLRIARHCEIHCREVRRSGHSARPPRPQEEGSGG